LKPFYPIGLCCLSSVLKERGHKVSLVDGEVLPDLSRNAQRSSIDRIKARIMPSRYMRRGFNHLRNVMADANHHLWGSIVKEIISASPDVIGMTSYTQNVTSISMLARMLRNRLPYTPIVLGGIHASSEVKWTLENIKEIDYLIIGEGETTLIELCDVIESKEFQLLDNVRGLAYRKNGQVTVTQRRSLIPDLNKLPLPDREIIKNRRLYNNTDMIFTSRGCPFNCTFCASKILWEKKIRFRSVKNVLEEIDLLVAKYNSSRIRIGDDTFTLSKKRVEEFCKGVMERGYNKNITFSIGSRVDSIDEEMVKKLAEIGTDTISFGIESGSPKILGKIAKGISPLQVEKTIRLASSYGIRCMCYFMIGHPEETADDVKRSMQLFNRIAGRYVDAELNVVSPYPGTELWEIAKARGWAPDLNSFYKMFHQGESLVNLTNMTSQELMEFHRLFRKRISRHGLVCKANTIGHLIVNGHLRTALQMSIMN
jgi:anaerobic magnesium-protoporphyrin IX monomethyl ester cyclase